MMKIISFSDLHLEFGKLFDVPDESIADVMILAGDIITFADLSPLEKIARSWRKPILYVAGNHEFYTRTPMQDDITRFKAWSANYPHLYFLQDEPVTIDGVHFFGGTMWTDFNSGNPNAMMTARQQMNDFQLIRASTDAFFHPEDSILLHNLFKTKLISWFEENKEQPRVVISHHAPVINPNTRYRTSPLQPAFNSLDMIEVIEKYQPNLWVYGHTHECDDQTLGSTRIISNQRGYPNSRMGFECEGFDPGGVLIEIAD